jgi:hypothetical protein
MRPITITILDERSIHIQCSEFAFMMDDMTTETDTHFRYRMNLQCQYEEESDDYIKLKRGLYVVGDYVFRSMRQQFLSDYFEKVKRLDK